MSLKFVIGPAGSGKTTWCLEQARHLVGESSRDSPVLLLVPEQASFQTEKALLSGSFRGTVRARVFSFARLASWIFSQTPGSALPRLSDVHRRVLVTSILTKMRRTGEPGTFSRIRSIEKCVAEILHEMKEFRVGPGVLGDWAKLLSQTEPVLAQKLEELAHIASEFDQRVRDRFEDPEFTIAALRDSLKYVDSMQGAHLIIDGFYGFTAVELEVLRGLLFRCSSATVALTMTHVRYRALRETRQLDLMSRTLPTEETLVQLLALAIEENIPIGEPVFLPGTSQKTRFSTPSLAHLERHFQSHRTESSTSVPASGIRLQVAHDYRDEVRRAAEQLLEWHETNDWPWGEMCILTRNLDQYANLLTDQLRAFNIPHFMDRHEPLETHPIIRGVLSALETVLGNWQSDTIFEFAKSGLYPFDADQVALLEDFTLAYPRESREWLASSPWSEPPMRSPFEEESGRSFSRYEMPLIESTRATIVAPLKNFSAEIKASSTEEGIALKPLMLVICSFIHHGMSEPNEADLVILKAMGELFDHLIESGGDEKFTPETALDLLRETLGKLNLPRIPPIINQVLIGQADRSRVGTVKGTVILGLVEGQFPSPGSNATLLTDRDRDQLSDLAGDGMHLRPSSRILYQREAFFAYIALTRASHALLLLRPLNSLEGNALSPSPYWLEIERMFRQPSENKTESESPWSRAARPRELAAVFCRDVLDSQQRFYTAPLHDCSAMLRGWNEKARDEFHAIFDSASQRNQARIAPQLVHEMFGDQFRTSVSGLESFSNCPFQFFMRTLVAPHVAPNPKLQASDVGNLAHAALKELTDRLIREERSFGDLPDDEIPSTVSEAFTAPLERLGKTGILNRHSARITVELLQRQVTDLVQCLADEGRSLNLRPRMAEASFGRRIGLRGIEFDATTRLGHVIHVRLRGQIDRIDLAVDSEGKTWAIVMDFKLSDRTLKWAEAADGKSLQLPVYLLVIEANAADICEAPLCIAGAFYASIFARIDKPRLFRGVSSASAWDALLSTPGERGRSFFSRSPSPNERTATQGDVIADRQFDALIAETRKTIERQALEIFEGHVDVKPAQVGKSTPCGYCDFRSACRLDYTMNSRRIVRMLARAQAIDSWLGPP